MPTDAESDRGLSDELTAQEREQRALVLALCAAGSLHPLAAPLQDGDGGRRLSKEALRTLADYDLEALVDCTLVTVADAYER